MAQLPEPCAKPVGGVPGQREAGEAIHRRTALIIGQVSASDKTTKGIRHLAVYQVGSCKLFLTEAIRVEAAREQGDDDAGVHDPLSPRP